MAFPEVLEFWYVRHRKACTGQTGCGLRGTGIPCIWNMKSICVFELLLGPEKLLKVLFKTCFLYA